jgi:uncharacterized protein (TIRG00374 family)
VLALGLALDVFTYLLRAWRFLLLLPREARPSFARMLTVSSAHNMASYVLPAKTGEASYVLYLNMHCGVSSALGLASLLVARFLDAAVFCLWMSVACLLVLHGARHPALEWLGRAGGILGALTFAFLVLAMRGDLLVRLFETALRWVRVHRIQVGARIMARSDELARALRTAGRGGGLVGALLLSIPMWTSILSFYVLLGTAMGLPSGLDWAEGALGSSLATASNLLPFNGAAGFGTQELGWVVGFHELLGVDEDVALSTGLGVHLIQLLNILAMGFIAHLVMGIRPRLVIEPPIPPQARETVVDT